MTYWAIKWLPKSGRGAGFIDYCTVTQLRRDAWQEHADNISEHATPKWLKELKRRRRLGLIRAVKVEIKECV